MKCCFFDASSNIINHLKAIFSRQGIPANLITANGPQYSSEEMKQFSSTYGFQHTTSSPHYHQSNGQAERAVRTVKSLLTNSSDPYLASLNYRATPLPLCGLSPAVSQTGPERIQREGEELQRQSKEEL